MGSRFANFLWLGAVLSAGHLSLVSAGTATHDGAEVPVLYEDGARGPYWGAVVGAGPPSLATDYAESAMPEVRGRKSVFFGALMLLVLLALTEWRIKGPQPAGSLEERIQKAQDRAAALINMPFQYVNKQLEQQNKAVSARLGIFMGALVFVLLGAIELLHSSRQRHNHKKIFPILRRSPSVKASTAFALLVVAIAFYGFALVWPQIGVSLDGHLWVPRRDGVQQLATTCLSAAAVAAAADGQRLLQCPPEPQQGLV
ncbi:hypothetical protein Efla_007120 [Eimeria flavescens]